MSYLSGNQSEPSALPFDIEPLSAEFLDSVSFLHEVRHSQLFTELWQTLPDAEGTCQQIRLAAKAWEQLWVKFGSGKISFEALGSGIAAAACVDELMLLSRTYRGLSEIKAEAEMKWVNRVSESVNQWLHLDSVHQHTESLVCKLKLLHQWVNNGQAEIIGLEKALAQVLGFMKGKDPKKTFLEQVGPVLPYLAKLDPTLVSIDAALFEEIGQSKHLLRWLRSKSNDQVRGYACLFCVYAHRFLSMIVSLLVMNLDIFFCFVHCSFSHC